MSELRQIEEIAQIKQGRYTSPNELSERPTEHSKVPVWGANGILGYTQNATYEEAQPLVTCRGNGCGLIQWSGGRAHISNNAMAIVLPSQSQQSSKYLYYSLLNTDFTDVTTGSAQPQITMGHLSKKEIFWHSNPEERTAIAHILGTLDDKIELNRKTNETLEAMAKALFKSWFVDFDPVRAKAEGRPTGLPVEISDLFPESFEDSELGEIPSGWEVTSSDNFCRSVRDGTHDSPKPVSKGGHPLVTSKHIKGRILDLSSTYKISTEDFDNVNKRSLVEKGDVLISMIGTLGEILYVDEDPKFAIKNVGLFKSRSEGSGQWWYLFLQSQDVGNFLRISAQGSTQQYLSLRTLRSIPVTIPTENILRYFGRVSGDIFRRKLVAKRDIEILGQIRNSLLPKLISGEIRIPDAEKMLEEVGI